MAEKYFIFSSTQLEFRKAAELTLGRKFKPGYVIVNGKRLPFTEINKDGPSASRYSDAKTVYHGDTDKVRYTLPGY